MIKYCLNYFPILVQKNSGPFLIFFTTFILGIIYPYITVEKVKIVDNYHNIVWMDTIQKKFVYLNKAGSYELKTYSSYEMGNVKYNSIQKTMTLQWIDVQDGFQTIVVVLFFIGLSLSIIIFFAQAINPDYEFFEYKQVHKETLKKLITLDEEGGVCYYHLMGRLLFKDVRGQVITSIYDLNPYLNSYIENKNLFPKWEGTTQEKRDKKLNQILK